MKIMIFGDSASGKSTFATKLGRKLNLPVLHLDEIMENIGRERRNEIGAVIQNEANKSNWIIEGNAFTKDKEYRIKQADIVVVFSGVPILTLLRHIVRHFRIQSGNERRIGSPDTSLNLSYFIPYIFIHFPKRKRQAVAAAHLHDKKVIIVSSFWESNRLLEEWKF